MKLAPRLRRKWDITALSISPPNLSLVGSFAHDTAQQLYQTKRMTTLWGNFLAIINVTYCTQQSADIWLLVLPSTYWLRQALGTTILQAPEPTTEPTWSLEGHDLAKSRSGSLFWGNASNILKAQTTAGWPLKFQAEARWQTINQLLPPDTVLYLSIYSSLYLADQRTYLSYRGVA